MVNRLDLLHEQIGGPKLQAVTKVLNALRKDMRTEVQQKLSARFAHTNDWTVCRAGNIAEEIEQNAAKLSLYTGKSTGSGGGVTTMLWVNPAVPLQPVVTKGPSLVWQGGPCQEDMP
jgi:hypothetical protein